MRLEGGLLTIGQAARVLGVDRRTVSDLVRLREIPICRLGMAKGIDSGGMRALRQALSTQPLPADTRASA